MARKPPPGLPDVFARPGAATTRGTAIEDLPVTQAEPEPAAESSAAQAPEYPAQGHVAAADTPPQQPQADYRPDSEPPPAPASPTASRIMVLVLLALLVSLTAPFWENHLLAGLGIRTPVERAAEYAIMAVARQDQRMQDIGQRLATTGSQMASLRAELAAASRRADVVATMTRTMAMVRLSDTLRRPVPFAAELAVARASGNDLGELKPVLDQIEPYAATGIPGAAQLRTEFATLYDQIAHGDRGILPTAWMSSLASWAHLRTAPKTPPAADPSLGLLQNAAARVADADLAGALDQLSQLSETYKPAFASWMQDAQARVAADTLADKVGDMVTRALGSK